MCQGCQDAVDRWFPTLSKKEVNDLLWGATAFPMCDPEYLERQLRDIYQAVGTNVNQAIARADQQMFEAHQRYKGRYVGGRGRTHWPEQRIESLMVR